MPRYIGELENALEHYLGIDDEILITVFVKFSRRILAKGLPQTKNLGV